jgi:hypothetical protein
MSELARLLRVDEVRARYGLRDRRAARAVMEQAGAFLVAGRLVVRADRLEAWEQRQEAARRTAEGKASAAPPPRSARKLGESLPPGWWRKHGDAA